MGYDLSTVKSWLLPDMVSRAYQWNTAYTEAEELGLEKSCQKVPLTTVVKE